MHGSLLVCWAETHVVYGAILSSTGGWHDLQAEAHKKLVPARLAFLA